LLVVQPARDSRARSRAWPTYESDSGDALAGNPRQTTGKRPRGWTVCAGVPREFVPNPNSELIVNRGRIADDAARIEIGEISGFGECWPRLLRRWEL
jgi:hypothetical protein